MLGVYAFIRTMIVIKQSSVFQSTSFFDKNANHLILHINLFYLTSPSCLAGFQFHGLYLLLPGRSHHKEVAATVASQCRSKSGSYTPGRGI